MATDLADVNSVRFASDTRVWLFAEGSQIVTSQQLNPALVGASAAAFTDANRDTKGTAGNLDDDTCKINPAYSEGIADAFFATPDVGYIVAVLVLRGVLHHQQPRHDRGEAARRRRQRG